MGASKEATAAQINFLEAIAGELSLALNVLRETSPHAW
jgi:hypothetical protein